MTQWTDRDYPILEVFAESEANGSDRLSSDHVATKLGMDARDAWIGMQALRDAEYVSWNGSPVRALGFHIVVGPRLSERGRRALGQWPADGYDAFVAILEARIEAAGDDVERSRLERFREGLLGMGRDVAVDFLSAVFRDIAGLR